MTGTAKALSLVLKNDGYEMVRFSEAVDDFAEENDFREHDRYELQLCLEEVVMNIINYGFDDLEEHDIHVDMQLQDDNQTVVARIIDDGKQFDPLTDAQKPDLDSLLEDNAMGGIGFRLVHKYVDDISYEHRDGRNHLTLTKKVASQVSKE